MNLHISDASINNYSRITINMSEYQHGSTVQRLIGAPPGFIGYEEGGEDSSFSFTETASPPLHRPTYRGRTKTSLW